MPSGVVSNGNEFFVFSMNSKVLTYDFEDNKWSVKSYEKAKDIKLFSFVEIPSIKNYDKPLLKKNRKNLVLSFALFLLICFVLVFY